MSDGETIDGRLAALRAEHRALDAEIEALSGRGAGLEVQRLKREKLRLRDEIARLESAPPEGG